MDYTWTASAAWLQVKNILRKKKDALTHTNKIKSRGRRLQFNYFGPNYSGISSRPLALRKQGTKLLLAQHRENTTP